jgi:hypothetical protein
MHCSPEASGESEVEQSNNAKNGTSAERGSFPQARPFRHPSVSAGVVMKNSKLKIQN